MFLGQLNCKNKGSLLDQPVEFWQQLYLGQRMIGKRYGHGSALLILRDFEEYAQLCYCLDDFYQFNNLDLTAELLETHHKALLRGLQGIPQKKALNPDFT
ncbi:hypothetical protein AJ79_10350 [Helicocarpus griseus UAMH5409]|uniref:Uncharacterized protein n=1 Tax=Helicocarpus griseus UAMH5409 TaxID=1447875 RepID=A0A2B7WE57_9EURO|nr:hypothetical protein AJ79_10350 [Helicocarpus griseus UAMH5409]